jgi:hypothetical protein
MMIKKIERSGEMEAEFSHRKRADNPETGNAHRLPLSKNIFQRAGLSTVELVFRFTSDSPTSRPEPTLRILRALDAAASAAESN